MKMKQFLPQKKDGEYRVRPMRTVIACVLIAVLLVSISVSMGYSQYVVSSEPLSMTYQIKDFDLPSDTYVVQPAAFDATGSYSFVSPDTNVKVLYSKQSADADYLSAEYLAAYFNQEVNTIDYTSHTNQIKKYYEIGLYGVNHNQDIDMFGLKSSIEDQARGIILYFSVGNDADPSSFDLSSVTVLNTASSLAETAISTTRVADYGEVAIGSFGQLFNDQTQSNSRFEISYDKNGWSAYADTAWYTDDSEDPEFWITSAAQLAGLAKLVNDGTEDFEGKTIYLNENISLADASGYLRKWTPIGTAAHPFKGVFDGQGKTISGLNVADFGAIGEFAAAGLFGYVDGTAAEIKNMTVDTAYLAAELLDASSAPSGAIGTAVGWMENGTVSGVIVKDATVCGAAAYGGVVAGRIGAAATIDAGCQITGDSAVGSGFAVSGELFGYQTPAEP